MASRKVVAPALVPTEIREVSLQTEQWRKRARVVRQCRSRSGGSRRTWPPGTVLTRCLGFREGGDTRPCLPVITFV